MSSYKVVYIALGSNLGNSINYLDKAVAALQQHLDIRKPKVSRYYQSKPHGPQDQSDYINAAMCFETSLKALELLDVLQKIENDNMRVRDGVVRWGARTLDLDLLFYGNEMIDTQRLTVPHPRICERVFVLFPLRDLGADVDKNLINIGGISIKKCIKALTDSDLRDIKEITQ